MGTHFEAPDTFLSYLWILGTPKLDSILSPFKCILQHRFVLLGKSDSWKASLHPIYDMKDKSSMHKILKDEMAHSEKKRLKTTQVYLGAVLG